MDENEAEKASTEKVSAELKKELLRAMFVVKNLNFRGMGHQRFGMGFIRHDVKTRELGLNMPAFVMLKQLQEREDKGETGGAWLTEMRDYLCVSKAAVSQMLGTLEHRGLVTREPDPDNRRTVIVRLTAEGRETIERFERGFDSYIGMMVDRFGEKDTKEIIRLIYKFAEIVEEIKE